MVGPLNEHGLAHAWEVLMRVLVYLVLIKTMIEGEQSLW